MSDNEYDEENLDDFMINASSILCESSSDNEKNMILDTLKQHLSQIFHEQSEMQNFFNTLNGIIFTQNSSDENPDDYTKPQKIVNKQPFKLYPIVFSFNPKTSYYYIDNFIHCLKKSTSEENRGDFTFLSTIFAEMVLAFYSDEKNNKNLLKKNLLLEQNKKIKLFDKILNFCNDNIKKNNKTEQSFGLLLLTEFIEKCPLVKEEKYLDHLFKIISDYLDDRWFECKLDLLNCTISLIFTAESKFKPYANICLFRVLDYLTDSEWMKRKLAINIVYTLVFYCKEEILAVKENIIDFLNMLKEDPVEEVRDVCLQTLKFIEDNDPERNLGDNNNNFNKFDTFNNDNNDDGPKNAFNKIKNKEGNKNQIAITNKNFSKNKNNANINKSNDNSNIKEQEKEKFININLKENDLNINIDNNNLEPSIDSILQRIKKIQEDQNKFISIINNIQDKVNINFSTLSERIDNLEKIAGIKNKSSNIKKSVPQNKINNNLLEYNTSSFNSKDEEFDIRSNKGNNNNKKLYAMSKKEEQNKIEEIKKKFTDGKYNEALIESKENDKYLIILLPYMDKFVIPKIDVSILEDVIGKLNKRLSIICLGNGRENINDILNFYIRITKQKLNLKLMTQLSIKDTLKFIKSKSIHKLNQSDINSIDIILKGLKV